MVTCLLDHGADPNLPGLDHGVVGGDGKERLYVKLFEENDFAGEPVPLLKLWDSHSETYDTSAIDPATAATPLSVARHIGHEGIVALLEARGAVCDPKNMSLPLNGPRDGDSGWIDDNEDGWPAAALECAPQWSARQ